MDERKVLDRIMWALEQEACCHEHMIGFGPRELKKLFDPKRFGHLIVIGMDYDVRN